MLYNYGSFSPIGETMFQQLLTTEDVKVESILRKGGNSLKTTLSVRGCRAAFENMGHTVEVIACWPMEMSIGIYRILEKKAEQVLLNKHF